MEFKTRLANFFHSGKKQLKETGFFRSQLIIYYVIQCKFDFEQLCGSGVPGTISRSSLLREKCPRRERDEQMVGTL